MPIPRRWATRSPPRGPAALGCASRLPPPTRPPTRSSSRPPPPCSTASGPRRCPTACASTSCRSRARRSSPPWSPTRSASADEDKDQTGLSHYLEHLLFKGTDKLMPGDIDRVTQRNGGREQRLHDRGHDGLPLRLRRRPLEDGPGDRGRPDAEPPHRREARVPAGEGGGHRRAEGERGPAVGPGVQGDPAAAVPEGRRRTGTRSSARSSTSAAATAEIIKRYYDQWYHPNNAALVVVGGFDPDEALAKIKKLFGPIPKGELPRAEAGPADPAADRSRSARSSRRSSTCRG